MRKALMLLTLLFVPSCGDDPQSPTPHETATTDKPDVATTAETTPQDVAGEASTDSSPTCSPSCGPGEICCTDAHGHFPRCVSGSTCP